MDFIKAAYFEEAGRMSLADVDKPTIQNPDDVIIRVIRTCVCRSDLWSYKEGDQKETHPINGGHEAIGIVEETGEKITTVKPGDFVIAPFTHGCGQCQAWLRWDLRQSSRPYQLEQRLPIPVPAFPLRQLGFGQGAGEA